MEKNIRTIVCLAAEGDSHVKIREESDKFVAEKKINRFSIPLEGQKEPFKKIEFSTIEKILKILLDNRNHPVLIHCDKGMHRTGVIIGCLRKLMGWNLSSIFYEYESFTRKALRIMDFALMETFSMELELLDRNILPDYIVGC